MDLRATILLKIWYIQSKIESLFLHNIYGSLYKKQNLMHYAVLYNIKKTLKHKNNLKCAQSVL